MMLFLGILALVTGIILSILATVALMSMALNGGRDGRPLRVVAGVTGIILLATNWICLLVITVDQPNAPHTTCGASSIKEEP